MNKVITINLNGVAYQLEEGGYEALREYLDHAARRLEGNPDKDEIIADIEQAIADKFRALLGAHKTVVITREVTAVITEMGPVEDATKSEPAADAAAAGGRPAAAGAAQAHDGGGAPPPVRRLYRIHEGAMLSGVCNGLGAYFGIDPTFIRIGFVVLTFVWGAGILVYLLMSLVVPAANTPAEKAAASGMAATAQEFIRRAKEGYYDGMKTWHDKQAHRAWKRKFKQEMRGWKYRFEREAQEHAHQWQQNWQQNWPQPPPSIFGAVFIAPLLSILLFVLLLALLYALYSLVTAHAVLGVALPAGMPLWVGGLLLVILYLFVAWPIKAVRYACYYPGHYYGHCGPWGGLFGSLIGLFFLAFGIWELDRHVPEFHEWLVQLPILLHRFSDTVQAWFARHS